MDDEYFISVGAGQGQLPLIEEIKRFGYKVISIDKNNDAPGRWISDIFLNISTYDSQKIIKYLESSSVKIAGILTRATGEPVLTVAKIAQKFHLKSLDITNATLFTNKFLLISALNKYDVPSPKMLSKSDLNNIDYPVFVKPSKTVLSHAAMKICFNKKELYEAIKQAGDISETKDVNIEEYLTGRDVVSIDFIVDGQIVHIATIGELSSGEPYFDGIGWYSVCDDYGRLAEKSFKKMKERLSVKNGFLQTAMKVDLQSKSAKIYEIHAEIGEIK
jgi:predicted ATP-grasp superfamily ATP-dependent carboligase